MTASDQIELWIEDDPAPEDIAALDDKLAEFTAAASGHESPEPLAVFARHEGTVAGGIHGWTWGGCCELVSLWVDEPRRRRGLGHAVLAAAEDAARRRRCRQVVLFTHAFQAPQLYTSGYELVGQVDDYPTGSAALWFRKRLDRLPRARVSQLLHATLYAAIAVLLVAELADDLGILARRTARRLADTYTRFERRERRKTRHTGLAVLARRLRLQSRTGRVIVR